MGGQSHNRVRRKPGLLILALLALCLQVMVPQGFMASAKAGIPSLVICTGHGALALPDRSDKAPKPKTADSACVFAGHGAVASPPTAERIAAVTYAIQRVVAQAHVRQSPGRGLAAPPPPSRGPPALI